MTVGLYDSGSILVSSDYLIFLKILSATSTYYFHRFWHKNCERGVPLRVYRTSMCLLLVHCVFNPFIFRTPEGPEHQKTLEVPNRQTSSNSCQFHDPGIQNNKLPFACSHSSRFQYISL